MTKTEIVKAIEENIVGKNAERNRAILYRRLIDGICFEPLASVRGREILILILA